MRREISTTTEVARAPVARVAAMKHFLPAILFTVCFGVYVGNGDFLPGNDQVGNMLFSVNLLKRHSFAISPRSRRKPSSGPSRNPATSPYPPPSTSGPSPPMRPTGKADWPHRRTSTM